MTRLSEKSTPAEILAAKGWRPRPGMAPVSDSAGNVRWVITRRRKKA